MHHHLLPPEIWIEILRWATTSPRERGFITASYTPFQPTSTDHFEPVTVVKRALVLVCREWHRLTTEYLYENIRVLRDTNLLNDVLGRDRIGASVRA